MPNNNNQKTVEQLRKEIADLKAQVASQVSTKVYYYTIVDGEVKMNSGDALPSQGSFAAWQGEKGAKQLKTFGELLKTIESLPTVKGKYAFRIKPLLKGFIWSPKEVAWVRK